MSLRIRKLSCLVVLISMAGCQEDATTLIEFEDCLAAIVPELLVNEKVAGVGIGVVRDSKVYWTGFYGEQSPGVPLTESTVFNTASIAKTITAETLIALHHKSLIDLDEPIAKYIRHADLSRDPRYRLLTSRLLMAHRGGLLNWASSYDDGRLAFDHDPDTRFSYSGAGVELAARYAEEKTKLSLQALTDEHVMTPIGVSELSLGDVPDWAEGRLATPMDSDGKFRDISALNPALGDHENDQLGAADDLIVTVPAYTQLIAALARRYGPQATHIDRETILTTFEGDEVYSCPDLVDLQCPDSYGHAVGWQVFSYGEHAVISHSGSDAGENALVYYSPDQRHGAVIFVNGANGWFLMTRIIEAIGDEPLLADYYRGLIRTVMGREMPALADVDKAGNCSEWPYPDR